MRRAWVVAVLILAATGAPVASQTIGSPPVAGGTAAGLPANAAPAVAAATAASPVTRPSLAGNSMLKPAPVDTSLPRQKIVTVFGTEPCPKSSDPDEIIICTRQPIENQYRIPPAVRSDVKAPTPIEGNRKILLGDDAGGAGGGIGSCSAVGPGGGTGCQQQLQDTYRAAKKAGEVPKSPF